jgi:hypothetical protein
MRIPVAALAAAALLATAPALLAGPAEASGRARDALERPFAPEGRVEMELSAGDYLIVGSDEPAIQIEWSTRDVGQLKKVRVNAEVDGSRATVRTEGPSNHFSVTIRVPRRSDLDVHLTAGDLKVEGIEGNKAIRSRAGDVDIDLVRADDYAKVSASLWAGDLRAEPLGISKGGLFRSFDWTGKGRYDLSVHLLAGDVRLYSSASTK